MKTQAQLNNAAFRQLTVLYHLRVVGGPRTVKRIGLHTGIGLANVRSALKELESAGYVRKYTEHYGSLAHATVWLITPQGTASALAQ